MSRLTRAKSTSLNQLQKRAYLKLISNFKKTRVLVIGDFILDQFIWGKVDRISPEAPVPVVHVTDESFMLGGSLNVSQNIHDLGGGVTPCGVLGRDRDGRVLKRTLQKKGINVGGIVFDRTRPTSVKTRVIAHSQQVVRFDREKTHDISKVCQKGILKFVKKQLKQTDVVVIEDYGKGVMNGALLKEIIRLAKKIKKPVIVDPKEKHFHYYKNVTAMTPNRKELFAGADNLRITHDGSVQKAAKGLMKKLQCANLLVTLGEEGMLLVPKRGRTLQVPTTAQEVYDVSGAGDTVVAVLSLAIASGASMKDASILANLASGIVVGKLGTSTIQSQELKDAVLAA